VSIDVNGNDNSPEWGWCQAEGCDETAYPIWESGGYPDDPDLLLCEKHIGETIARLRAALAWYADLSNYDMWRAPRTAGGWRTDRGERARLALEQVVARRAAEHPGAALLAELTAARAVVEAARTTHNGASVETRREGMRAIGDALDAYDEAAKARAE